MTVHWSLAAVTVAARVLSLLSGLLLLPVLALAGVETVVDGIPHVSNADAPSGGHQTLLLQEEWRLGGGEEDLFGRISTVLTGDDGRIYLFDRGFDQIHVVSPDGTLVHSYKCKGEGPGEASDPQDLLFMPDGTLGIVDRFPGKIVKIALDGTPAGTVRPMADPDEPSGFLGMYAAIGRAGSLVVMQFNSFEEPAEQTRNVSLSGYDLEGRRTARYAELEYSWEYSDLVIREIEEDWIWGRWTVTRDGRILAPRGRNDYVIEIFEPDGSLARVFSRDYEPVRRDRARKQEVKERKELGFARQLPHKLRYVAEDVERAVIAIHGADDDSIWILTSAGRVDRPAGVLMTWDVFDAAGHFVKQVDLAGPGDPDEDRFHFSGHDALIRVSSPGDEEAVEIFRYALVDEEQGRQTDTPSDH